MKLAIAILGVLMLASVISGRAQNSKAASAESGHQPGYGSIPTTDVWHEMYDHQQKLYIAAETRVLTPAELHEFLDAGYMIYAMPEHSFYESDLRARFLAALEIQKVLREMEKPAPCK